MRLQAQLICAFVFAYAKSRFSHDIAHILKDRNSVRHQKNWEEFINIYKLSMTKLTIMVYVPCENEPGHPQQISENMFSLIKSFTSL